MYVLVDNSFAWTRYCSAPEGQDTKFAAAKFLAFPSGMIRGALAAFGLDCVVSADIGVMPQCMCVLFAVATVHGCVLTTVIACRYFHCENKRLT